MRFVLAAAAAAGLVVPVHADEIAAQSRIGAVTVFPAGAEVQRVVKLRLQAGEHTLLFTDLPQQAVQGSIRVEGKATGALQIGSVDTRRVSVPRVDPAQAATERRRLEDEIQRLKDERVAQQAEIQTAEAQKAFVGNLVQLPTRTAAPGLGGAPAREDWAQLSTLIGREMAAAQKVILEGNIKIRQTDEKIRDLERRLREQGPGAEERTEVKVFVSAGAALEAEIVIRYQVASASWSALYDARLSTGTRTIAPKLVLTRRAQIIQRTSESWNGIALTLSTTQPAAGTAAPVLRPLTVDFQPERPAPVAAAPPAGAFRGKMKRAEEAPESEASEDALAKYADVEEKSARVESAPFQAVFNIPGRLDIPNTGDPKRVQLDEAQVEPVLAVRAVPRIDARAFLYAKLTVPKTTPYLPGTVALFRDETFVGNGRLPLLAPGEEHELGFGADDLVKVRSAVVEEKKGEGGLISATRSDQRIYRLTVKNMHERQILFTVLDQIPVANHQDIKVEFLGRVPPTKRDVEEKRGVLAWEDKLGPDEERSIEFGYRLTWPAARPIVFGR